MTNDVVLKMIAAGLPDEAIVAKIKTSQTQFDLGTDQLIVLKNRGVSGPVLAAMLQPAPPAAIELSADSPDPAKPHFPGIYLVESPAKWSRILPTASDQAKTGGIFGYALTGGLASASVKAKISGTAARIQTNNVKPVFYMFFDESVPRGLSGASVWITGAGSQTSSPTELSLVRLVQKSNGREARVGSINIAGSKSGVMDKDRIAFDVEQVRPGVFTVSPKYQLEAGEYGFVQSVTGGNVSGGGGALTARIFDFGVAKY